MAGLKEAVARVRPAVVQIGVRQSDMDTPEPLGTGFFASDEGLVLTARHVVEACRQVGGPDGEIVLGLAIPTLDGPVKIRGSFEVLSAEVVEEDPRHDLALLRAAPNPFASGRPSGIFDMGGSVGVNGLYGLVEFDPNRPPDGEAIAVSGYPLAEPALVTTHGVIASAWGVDIAQIHRENAPEGWTIPDMKDSYLADVAVNGGNSGGPVYRVWGGVVIGICVAFRIGYGKASETSSLFAYNSGLSVVVPAQYGIELVLRHHGKGSSPAALEPATSPAAIDEETMGESASGAEGSIRS